MTIEQMPTALELLLNEVKWLRGELQEMREQQPINETPIAGKVLRERLGISDVQEIRLRNRGELPFLQVGGNYRYNWTEVLKAFENKANNKKNR